MEPFRGSVGVAITILALAIGPMDGLLAPGPLEAQVIPVKTIPLATGDQFLVHPSERTGMGSVSLALDDPEGDPFVNPAKATRLEASRLVGDPTYYSVSDGNGSGTTLPVTVLLSSDGPWSGGVSLAIQEIRGPEPPSWGWAFDLPPGVQSELALIDPLPGDFRSLEERSAPNLFFTGVLARRLGNGWSLGAGVTRADLDAVDGVEHLFPGSRTLEQDATMTDFRAGVIHDGDAGTLEAVLLHRRFDGEYRAGYLTWVQPGDPTSCEPGFPCGEWRTVTEINPDRTRTTGLQVGWVHRMEGSPWRVGTTAVLNYKDHPDIPNYEIMSIPRDPGTTWAWSAGVGVGRSDDEGAYGADLILEPVRSETWALAEEVVERVGGGVLLPGERTVENDFDFNNVRIRLGGSRTLGQVRGELGLQVYAVSYDLVQDDRIAVTTRSQEESWVEWIPTWGLSMRVGSVDLSYRGRLTLGTGRPGTFTDQIPMVGVLQAADVDFLPAPNGPLALNAAHSMTHRLGVSVPLR